MRTEVADIQQVPDSGSFRVAQVVTVAQLGDIPEGGSIVVEVNRKDIAIFRVGGQYYAIDDLCPHAGASLSGGPVQDGVVTCPWHYWRFRLSDGAWVDNPKIKTGCYAVSIDGTNIQLSIPEV